MDYAATPDNTQTYSANTDSTVAASVAHHPSFTYDESKTVASGSQNTGVSIVTVGSNQVPQGVVNADGSPPLKLYYKRNVHQVSYEYTGAVPAGANPACDGNNKITIAPYTAKSYKYGETVTLQPEGAATGYTSHGWTVRSGDVTVTTDGSGNQTLHMADADVTF